MKHKSLHALLMLAAMLFAVIMAGGCGNSGGSLAFNDNGGTERNYDPSESLQARSIPKDHELMTALIEDFFALAEELSADGVIEKIDKRGLYMMEVSGDFDQNNAEFSRFSTVSRNETLAFSSDDLRPKYQAGAVISIASPTEESINALLEELGETPNFAYLNASDDLELYAVARGQRQQR